MIRHTTVLFILLAGTLSLVLFMVKYQVQDLEHEFRSLSRDIQDNEQAIDVLKAEWSYLNDPTRLRKLSERHLGMKPVHTDQLTNGTDLDDRIPVKSDPVSLAVERKDSPSMAPSHSSVADRMTDPRRTTP